MSSDEDSESDDFRSGSHKRRRGNKWDDDSDDDIGKLGRRQRTNQDDTIYGVFADGDGSDSEADVKPSRRAAGGSGASHKLHQPMAFVSAGVKPGKPWDAGAEADEGGGAEAGDEEDEDEEDGSDLRGRSKTQPQRGRKNGLARDEDVLERLGLGLSTGLGASDAAESEECEVDDGSEPAAGLGTAAPTGLRERGKFARLLPAQPRTHAAERPRWSTQPDATAPPVDAHALDIDDMGDTPSLVPSARPGLGLGSAGTHGAQNGVNSQAQGDTRATQQSGLSNSSFRELLLRAKQSSASADQPVSEATEQSGGQGSQQHTRAGIGMGLGADQSGESKEPPDNAHQDKKPAAKLGPGFAKFEQHTKGFGAKYLGKFGFAGRLGKNEQGITAPVEVKVRPNALGLGFGGFKEATKLKHNKQVEADYTGKRCAGPSAAGGEEGEEDEEDMDGTPARAAAGYSRAAGPAAPAAVRKAKPVKIVYKTAAELLAAQEGTTGPGTNAGGPRNSGLGTIIDMTGRRARLVGSVGDALTPSGTEDAEADVLSSLTVGKELVHNLALLRDQAEVELTNASRNAKAAKARAETLAREVKYAKEAEAAAAAKTAAYDTLRSNVQMWQQRLSALATECIAPVGAGTGAGAAAQKLSYLQQAYGGSLSSAQSVQARAERAGTGILVADDEDMAAGLPSQASSQRSRGSTAALKQEGPFFKLCHALSDAAAAYESLYASYSDAWSDLSYLWRVGPAMVAEALPALLAQLKVSLAGSADTLEQDGKLETLCSCLRSWHRILSAHAKQALSRHRNGQGRRDRDDTDMMPNEGIEDGNAMDEDDDDGGIPLPPGARPAGQPRRAPRRVAFGVPGMASTGETGQAGVSGGSGQDSAPGAVRALLELVQKDVLAYLAQQMQADPGCIRSPSALLHVLSSFAPSSTVSVQIPWGTAWGEDGSTQENGAQPVDLFSEAAYRAFLNAHVLPPLIAAVTAWDPFTDPVPVQDWTVPWAHPARLGPDTCSTRLWPAIRGKMSAALADWHPCDSSAVAMLRPWSEVWDSTSLQALCETAIIPKLIAVLRQLQGTMKQPASALAPQELGSAPTTYGVTIPGPITSGVCLGWVLHGWCVDGSHEEKGRLASNAADDPSVGLGGILPARHVSALLEGELLGPWMRAWAGLIGLQPLLRVEGQAQPSEVVTEVADGILRVQWAQVHAWYASWRACIPSVLLSLPSARMVIYHATQLAGVATRLYGSLAAGKQLSTDEKEELMGCARLLSRYSPGDADGTFRTSASGAVLPRSQGVTYQSILARDARTEATIAGLGYGSSTGGGSFAPPPTRPSTGPAAVSLPSALSRAAQAGMAPPGVTAAHVTFKDFVQAQVESAGLAFLPNPRRAPIDGCVVYRAGEVSCYLQHGVVFTEVQEQRGGGGTKYEPVPVEELVKRARAAAQRR